MITKAEILMGRDKQYPLDSEQMSNLQVLLIAVNRLRLHYGKPMFVSSGYRPATINAATKGAAKKSNHIICAAVDFKDADGKLKDFCMNNLHILEACGLWMEAPEATPTWLHVQIFPPKSGKRVFKP